MGQNFREKDLELKKKNVRLSMLLSALRLTHTLHCSFSLPTPYQQAKRRFHTSPSSAECTTKLDGMCPSPDWLYVLHFIAISLSEL